MTNPTDTDAWQTPSIEPISDAMGTSDQKSAPIRNAVISDEV